MVSPGTTTDGGAVGGVGALLDAVLEHLPARTATENPGSVVEDEEDEADWSPLG